MIAIESQEITRKMKKERPTEKKPKTTENMAIRTYIPIIILNVSILNASVKRHR